MMKKIATVLLAYLFSMVSAFAAFQPAEYVAADTLVYIESAEYSQVIQNIEKFYKNLKIPQAKNSGGMLEALGKKTEAELGLNLLDEASLKKAGFDNQGRVAVAISYENDETTGRQNAKVSIYLPAEDSDDLYNTVLRVFREEANKKTPGPNSRVAEIREIDSGDLFHYKKQSDIFVARGDSFVTINNLEKVALDSIKKADQPIGETDYYQSLKQSYTTRFSAKDQVLMYVVNPVVVKEITRATMKQLSYSMGMPMGQNSILMNELEQNLRSIGGFMSMTSADFSFSIDYIYKTGYLQDQTKLLPRILQSEGNLLSTDYYSKSPIVYLFLRFSIAKYIKLLKEADPNIASEIEEANRDFIRNTGMTLDKDLLAGLTGVFSFVIADIPAEVDLGSLNRWEGYLSFGYKPEFKKNYGKLMQKIKEQSIKNKKVSLKKSRYRNGDLWTIKIKGGLTSPRQQRMRRQPEKKKKPKTDYIFVYLGENEAIITTSRKYLAKALIKGGDSLLERLFKLKPGQVKGSNAVFYLNIATVVTYLNQSSLSAVLAGYLPLFQNMKNFNVQSITKKDVMSTEFNLTLKP